MESKEVEQKISGSLDDDGEAVLSRRESRTVHRSWR